MTNKKNTLLMLISSPIQHKFTANQPSDIYPLSTLNSLTALNEEVTRKAALMAYLQDFRFLMLLVLCAVPLLLLLQ